jgi:hypothetical protein
MSRGLLSTSSPTPRVRVPRHIAWLVVDFFAYVVRPGALAPRTAHRAARRAARCRLLHLSRVFRVFRVPRHVARLVTRLGVDYFAYAAHPGASTRRAAPCRLLHLHRASGCLGMLHGSSSTTSPTPCVQVPRHLARLIARLVAQLVVDYFAYAAHPGASARHAARHAARRRLLRLRRASGCLDTSRGSSSTTSTTPRIRVPRHIARLVMRLVAPLVVDYIAYAVHPGASACHAARRRLLRLRCASRCLGTSHGSSRVSSRRSSSTTPSKPRVSGASARRVARGAAHRRLLRLRRASGCLDMLHGSSRGSSSTSSPTSRFSVPRHVVRLVVNFSPMPCGLVPRHVARLVVDFFAYATHSGASAPRMAHREARRTARRRLLRLHRASGCLDMSRGSSRGSSSTTSTTPRIWVPRHVARLVTRLIAPLVVDYFTYAVRPGASARRAAHCRLLRLRHASGCLGTSRDSSSTTSPTPCV